MMINSIFLRSLRWQFLETSVYYVILTYSNIFLYKNLSSSEYCLFAASFSLIFFSIAFVNFGFDVSIIAIKNKFLNNFDFNFFIKRIIPFHFFMVLTFSFIFLKVLNFWFFDILNQNFFLIFVSIIIEALKKNARALLHILGNFQFTCFTEIKSISIYLSFLYALISNNILLTARLILLTFAIVEFVFLIILYLEIFKSESLKDILLMKCKDEKLYSTFFNVTMQSYFLSIIRSFLSCNFLIPVFSNINGILSIGSMHFVHNIFNGLLFFISNIFSSITPFLFSLFSDKKNNAIKSIFSFMSKIHLIALEIAAIILFLFLSFYSENIDLEKILLLLLINGGGVICIIFEKFLIIHDQILRLIINYIFSILLFLILNNFIFKLDLKFIILFLFFMRLIIALLLYYDSKKILND